VEEGREEAKDVGSWLDWPRSKLKLGNDLAVSVEAQISDWHVRGDAVLDADEVDTLGGKLEQDGRIGDQTPDDPVTAFLDDLGEASAD